MATLTKESSVSIRERDPETAAPRPAPRVAGSGGGARTGLPGRLQNMWGEEVAEIKKITWPSRLETRNLTIVVIGISVLVGGLLGLVDLILVGLVRMLTGTGGL